MSARAAAITINPAIAHHSTGVHRKAPTAPVMISARPATYSTAETHPHPWIGQARPVGVIHAKQSFPGHRQPAPQPSPEDAAFRRYLPLSRTLAHSAAGDATGPDRTNIEQAAELGLAKAVLAWGARTGAGFPRFARSGIIRELSSR